VLDGVLVPARARAGLVSAHTVDTGGGLEVRGTSTELLDSRLVVVKCESVLEQLRNGVGSAVEIGCAANEQECTSA